MKRLSNARREVFALGGGLALLAIAWIGSVFTLHSMDKGKPQDWNRASLLYLPSGKLLKPMALDLDEGLGAILWAKGVTYFSAAFLEDRGYELLAHILEITTALNPHFLYAYEFSGTVLGRSKTDWPKTREILRRGLEVFPQDWHLRVYLAMGLRNHDSNYVAAAEVLKPVALIPDVPNHIRTLSATLLEEGGEEKLALAFLVNQFLAASDPLTREVFVERILKFAQEVKSRPRTKSVVYKILKLAQTDIRSEELVITVLGEYLRGEPSPGSKRILGILGE